MIVKWKNLTGINPYFTNKKNLSYGNGETQNKKYWDTSVTPTRTNTLGCTFVNIYSMGVFLSKYYLKFGHVVRSFTAEVVQLIVILKHNIKVKMIFFFSFFFLHISWT